MLRTADIFAVTILVAATVLVNAHTFDFGFVYDDNAVVLERAPAAEQGWGDFLADRPWGIGRHLTVLSLDANRNGNEPPSPRPFHITNTALAALVSVLVFALGRALGMSTFAASAGAFLFTVHPLHVDAVVSIVGRAELLAAVFVLSAILLHLSGYPPRGLGLLAAGVMFLAGLESKESVACLLLLIPACDFTGAGRHPRRTSPAVYLTYGLALGAWLVFVGGHLSAGTEYYFVDNPLAFMPAWERILNACAILWRYAALVVWPAGLQTDRSFQETPTDAASGAVALLVWLVLALAAWKLRKRAPVYALLILWFPLAFAVTGNVVAPIGTIMADRLAFLPSVGPCLLAGGLLAGATTTRPRRMLANATLATCGLALALTYHAHSLVWASELHFHRQSALDAPDSAKTHYNLGLALARAGRLEEAMPSFGRAIAIYPNFYLATEYLARTLREQGQLPQAAAAYADYLHASPNDERALGPYVDLLIKLGRYREAHQAAETLLGLDPANRSYLLLLNRSEQADKKAVNP